MSTISIIGAGGMATAVAGRIANNWLRVFPVREFGYKSHQARVSMNTSEAARMLMLWWSKWRKASNVRGFQRN